jgi:hypothetical protein
MKPAVPECWQGSMLLAVCQGQSPMGIAELHLSVNHRQHPPRRHSLPTSITKSVPSMLARVRVRMRRDVTMENEMTTFEYA